MAKMGRPDVYATHVQPNLGKIADWYKSMSVRQIAAKLGISKTTLYKYAREYPELQAALDNGKDGLVDDLKSAIKKRALGYTVKEVCTTTTEDAEGNTTTITKTTTRHVPADLGSAHLLLKNLDPDWHDADMVTIKQREKELEIKRKRAEAAEW